MKYSLLILVLFAFGCTETVVEEVEKLIYRDSIKTVFVDRIKIDSVSYPVFINDTLYVPKTISSIEYDTIIDVDTVYLEKVVEKIVYDTIIEVQWLYDTIHVVQHHYHDTLYIPIGWSTTSVGEYQATVEEFYTEAFNRNLEFSGGDILIEAWRYDEAPPDTRSTYSFWYFDQFILKVRDDITADEAYSGIMRELARWQLGKKYTKEPNDLMNPDFQWTKLVLSDTKEKKKPYLDKLFQP